MLKELLAYIIEEIVSKPKKIKVTESTEGDGTTHLNLSSITDVTPIPHNGCRPPKVRRV